jgi:hypothetical protein
MWQVKACSHKDDIRLGYVQGFKLAGARNGDRCYCGGNDEHQMKVFSLGRAHKCNKRCSNDRLTFCGGSEALSVYRTNTGECVRGD